MTRVVVSNVQVLTAGTRYDQEKARDGQPIPTSVVTLLVTPPDAERIALAASEGEVMLTLRNPHGPRADRDRGHSHGGAARPGAGPPRLSCEPTRPRPRPSPTPVAAPVAARQRFTRSRPSGPPNVLKRLSVDVYHISFDALLTTVACASLLLAAIAGPLVAQARAESAGGRRSRVRSSRGAADGRPLDRPRAPTSTSRASPSPTRRSPTPSSWRRAKF